MKKLKIISITSVVTILIMFGISIFSPYNVLNRVHEKGLKDEFESKNVQSVTYKGDHTYVVKTDKKEYVVVQEYYTFMNYKWKVYELQKTWE